MRLKTFLRRVRISSGFTLIELSIVLGILGILSGAGIVSSLQYNRTQLVDSAARDFVTIVQTAKSRAFSQAKPTDCIGSLTEYRVTVSGGSYQLKVRCSTSGTKRVGAAKNVPSGVSMSRNVNEISFPVLTGEALLNFDPDIEMGSFTFTGEGGVTRLVEVHRDARVVLQ